MSSYLKVQYRTTRVPETTYPEHLIEYLADCIHRQSIGTIENLKLAEVGYGRGDFIKQWKKYFTDSKVYGFDIEPVEVEGVTCNYWDASTANYSNLYELDMVFSKSLIEHIVDPTHFLQGCAKMLKEKGILIIMCPDWKTYKDTFYDDYTHVKPYTQESLKDVLELNGFRVEKVVTFYQYPAAWSSKIVRLLMWLTRNLLPTRFNLWMTKTTGIQFFKWAEQLTLLAFAYKD